MTARDEAMARAIEAALQRHLPAGVRVRFESAYKDDASVLVVAERRADGLVVVHEASTLKDSSTAWQNHNTTANPAWVTAQKKPLWEEIVEQAKTMKLDRRETFRREYMADFLHEPSPDLPDGYDVSPLRSLMKGMVYEHARRRVDEAALNKLFGLEPPTAAEREEASNPTTPGGRLMELQRHYPGLCAVIARNPNVPTDELRRQMQQPPRIADAWLNPMAPLLAVELEPAEREQALTNWVRCLRDRFGIHRQPLQLKNMMGDPQTSLRGRLLVARWFVRRLAEVASTARQVDDDRALLEVFRSVLGLHPEEPSHAG